MVSSIPLNGSDEEVLDALGALLSARIPPNLRADPPALVAQLRTLPPGLRAMAATYELDISLSLDDLGWHFGNWPDQELARETLWGLRELGAETAAEIFEQALELAAPYWGEIARFDGCGNPAWNGWYRDSGLEAALDPLNTLMWDLLKPAKWGLMQYWVEYARKSPHRLMEALH